MVWALCTLQNGRVSLDRGLQDNRTRRRQPWWEFRRASHSVTCLSFTLRVGVILLPYASQFIAAINTSISFIEEIRQMELKCLYPKLQPLGRGFLGSLGEEVVITEYLPCARHSLGAKDPV